MRCRLEVIPPSTLPEPTPAGGLSGLVDNPSHRHERQRATSPRSFPSCPGPRVGNNQLRNPCRPCLPFPLSCGTRIIGNSKNQCRCRSSRIVRMYCRRCWRGVTVHTTAIHIPTGPCRRQQGQKFHGMALHRRWGYRGRGRVGQRPTRYRFINTTRRRRRRPRSERWAAGGDSRRDSAGRKPS